MGYQVALTVSARRDLRGIVRYISLHSAEQAVTFSQHLIHSTKRLADFPEIGRIVPEFGNSIIREIIVRSYRVIYRVDHDEHRVKVLRFWHGARGKPNLGTI